MGIEITVPSAGESVTEAVVANIMVKSGDHVEQDAEVLELETDKANQVVYAPAAGTITINVSVDETVQVGQVIATIEEGAGSAPAPKAEPKKEEAPPPPPPPKSSGAPARISQDAYVAEIGKKPEPKAAPAAPAPAAPAKAGQERKRMSGLRRTIAKRLVEVKNQTAMLTTFNEVDMSAVMALRSREKEKFEKKHGVRLGFMSFFIKACTSALQKYPEVNAFIDGDSIVYNPTQDVGVAVSTDKGLMVPVIRDCDSLEFHELEAALGNFAAKARDGNLPIDDMQGGTFTITNGGVFGSLLSTPILNPPQSGILGMHSIVKRPVVIDDQIVIRPMMYLALSYDHRIVDGRQSIGFLIHVKELLEDPARLLLDY